MANNWPGDPASFVDGELVGTTKLNEEIRDRMTYLYSRYRQASASDVVSTTTETDVLNKTIPAGDAGSDRLLRCVLIGDYLNNSGAARTLRMRIALGGTTLWDYTIPTNQSANRKPVRVEFEIGQLATNSQFMAGLVTIGSPTLPTTGIGSQIDANSSWIILGSNGPSSVDMSSAQTLSFLVQHDAANGSLSFRRQGAHVHLL